MRSEKLNNDWEIDSTRSEKEEGKPLLRRRARYQEHSLLQRRYIQGIDGLRSLAVLGVIFYHLIPKEWKGGYLGVTLFFVISGYLMTDILCRQWQENKFSIWKFYGRRIRRLLPAILILFIACGAVLPFLGLEYMVKFRGVVYSTLLNINNWWQLADGGNYFDQFSQITPFANLWSLSVEGQFYIFYPIIVFILLKLKNEKWLFGALALGTIASSIEMGMLYQPHDIMRIYYGTDTRMFSLLIGGLLALILRRYGVVLQSKFQNVFWKWIAGICIGITVWSFFAISDQQPFVYRGGMVLFSLIDAFLLLFIIVQPQVEQWFIHPFFHWCGTRSYEIYLWQFPVMIVLEHMWKINPSQQIQFITVSLLIIAVLAEITHRLVESFYLFQSRVKEKGFWRTLWRYIPTGMVACVGLMLFATGFLKAPTKSLASQNTLEQQLTQNQAQIQKQKKKKNLSPKEKAQQKAVTQVESILQGNIKDLALSQAQKEKAQKTPLTAIGDSVLLNAAPQLQEIFPNMQCDAIVGRQITDGIRIINQMNQNGTLAKNVLFALGTNGPTYNEEDFDQMLVQLKDKNVFIVNTKSNLYWQDEVNEKLIKASEKYKNIHLIQWCELANQHPNWFGDDQTHMQGEGSKYYAEFIAKNILADI